MSPSRATALTACLLAALFAGCSSGGGGGSTPPPIAPSQHQLSIQVSGAGTVQSTPSGTSFADGMQVSLLATPAQGSSFFGWTGDLSGNSNPISFTISRDMDIGASFAASSAQAPVGSFSWNGGPGQAQGLGSLDVGFSDTSSQNPSAWQWSFGDGSSSNQQHPSHIFAPGLYTVSLTASNSFGAGTPAVHTEIVSVSHPTLGSPYWYANRSFSPATLAAPSSGDADWAQQVFQLTNSERSGAGGSPLQWDAEASRAAQAHAFDMAGRDYFDHDTPEGWSFVDRLSMTGASGFSGGGENIAWGYSSPAAAVQGWKNSPGHWANMTNSSYTHIGIGVDRDARIYVQVFLRR